MTHRRHRQTNRWARRAVTAAVVSTVAATTLATSGGGAHAASLRPQHDYSSCPAAQPLLTDSTRLSSTRLASGVTLQQATVHDSRGPVQLAALRIDLTAPKVSLAPLWSHVAVRSTLSRLSQRSHLVAATNGMYFSFGYGAPTVPFVTNRHALDLTTVPLRAAGISTKGLAQSGNVWLVASVTAPTPALTSPAPTSPAPTSPAPTTPTATPTTPTGMPTATATAVPTATPTVAPTPTPTPTTTPVPTGPQVIGGINSVDPPPGLALYTTAWGSHAVPLPAGARSVPVVNGSTTATAGRGHTPPVGGDLLVATGATATRWLASLPKKTPLTIKTHVATDAPAPFAQAFGVGTQVVATPGVVGTNLYCSASEKESAHTSIGWADHGTQLLLVAVSGKSRSNKTQHGVDENQMSQFMVQLGADQAFALDGGGSTELLTRPPGHRLRIRTTLGDGGHERAIPVGVGVFSG